MAPEVQITLFQLNDSHGYLDLHPELFWAGDHAEYRLAGGMARIATLLNEARRNHPGAVLAFDGGDTIHGAYPAVQTRGEALIPILQALRFDAMTAHWDFAYGPERLQEVAAQLPYPMLAINCYHERTHELVFPPTTVIETAGLRVGVIGIAANIIDKVMPPSFSRGIYFTLGNKELPAHIARLRHEERVDLIVVLSHLGFPQDAKLACEVEGIDVLLSSHTHNRIHRPATVNGALIIQSGSHGSFLGRLDLEIVDGRLVDFKHRLITVDQSIEPDPLVQTRVDAALAPHREELAQVVGHTRTALNRERVLEATMDNLLLQSIQDVTGAQVAFSNGWRYGAPIPPGPITLNDLWNIIPVNPPVSTCEMTGDELWTMLEENLERTFARDPYQQMGGYVKRCLGLNLYFRIENPYTQRIQELFVQGKPVRADQKYPVAFVTTQGVPEQYGSHRQDLDVSAIEALRRYLALHDPVEAELRGTVVAI